MAYANSLGTLAANSLGTLAAATLMAGSKYSFVFLEKKMLRVNIVVSSQVQVQALQV